MTVRRVCKYGEKILRQKTRPVNFSAEKEELGRVIADMFETMAAFNGVGLSANQVGLGLRLCVILIPSENGPGLKLTLINPELVSSEGRQEGEEGCLSFPGFYARVWRAAKVKVRALNERGLPIEVTGAGLLARALQHELDHLDGVVFVDRLPLLRRLKLKPELARLKKEWAKAG